MSLSTATGEHEEPNGQQNPEPTRRPGRASPSRAPGAHVRWVAAPSLPRASGNPGPWNQEHDTKSSP